MILKFRIYYRHPLNGELVPMYTLLEDLKLIFGYGTG
jgi:hypothetical protein